MTLVGVTGTNGKTTTTYPRRGDPARAAGGEPGVIGTVDAIAGAARRAPAPLHHADAARAARDVRGDARRRLHARRDGGVVARARAGPRSPACAFTVAAFTNLTQDHLDFHGTMDAYSRRQGACCSPSICDARRRRRRQRRRRRTARHGGGGRRRARPARRRPTAAADVARDARRRSTVDGITRAVRDAASGELAMRSPLDRRLQRREPRARGRHRRGARA